MSLGSAASRDNPWGSCTLKWTEFIIQLSAGPITRWLYYSSFRGHATTMVTAQARQVTDFLGPYSRSQDSAIGIQPARMHS